MAANPFRCTSAPGEVGGVEDLELTDEGKVIVERLRRWQEFGAVWRVVGRSPGEVTIALCRCDDGEEVDRLTSRDRGLLTWIGSRTDRTQ